MGGFHLALHCALYCTPCCETFLFTQRYSRFVSFHCVSFFTVQLPFG